MIDPSVKSGKENALLARIEFVICAVEFSHGDRDDGDGEDDVGEDDDEDVEEEDDQVAPTPLSLRTEEGRRPQPALLFWTPPAFPLSAGELGG